MGSFFTFLFAILLVGIAVLTMAVVFIVRLARGGSAASSREDNQNETKMIQELYHGFSRMEERIETLEALLLDSECSDRKKDRKKDG